MIVIIRITFHHCHKNILIIWWNRAFPDSAGSMPFASEAAASGPGLCFRPRARQSNTASSTANLRRSSLAEVAVKETNVVVVRPYVLFVGWKHHPIGRVGNKTWNIMKLTSNGRSREPFCGLIGPTVSWNPPFQPCLAPTSHSPPFPGCWGFKGKLKSAFGMGSGILAVQLERSVHFDKCADISPEL
jgi:hypothetical protein